MQWVTYVGAQEQMRLFTEREWILKAVSCLLACRDNGETRSTRASWAQVSKQQWHMLWPPSRPFLSLSAEGLICVSSWIKPWSIAFRSVTALRNQHVFWVVCFQFIDASLEHLKTLSLKWLFSVLLHEVLTLNFPSASWNGYHRRTPTIVCVFD